MAWVWFLVGFVVSAPVGYLLGKRASAKQAAAAAAVPKKKPLTFDEMMTKTWTDMPKDPGLVAEVEADIEARLAKD